MVHIPFFIGLIGLTLLAVVGFSYFVSSIWERERRAVLFSGLQFLGMTVLLVVFAFLQYLRFFDTDLGFKILVGTVAVGFAVVVLLWARIGTNSKALEGTKGLVVGEVKRYDEREIVFARNQYLQPDTEEYKAFYNQHPEYEEYDAKRREVGGSLGKMGKIDEPNEGPNIAGLMANGFFVFHLSSPDKIDPPGLMKQRNEISPEEATARVKGFARSVGADLVGIAELDPNWTYSHRGMALPDHGEKWGQEIKVSHKYAVVFAMEMALDMVATAPHSPTTLESMRVYAEGADIAVRTASFIANLNRSASAEHLRRYNNLLVPLAVDAGLGELSRMGYLITKELGPRVRLAAVTTDLPLVPDKPLDIGVWDFCKICLKCAKCCPSRSIPLDDPVEINGTLRWKLNAETCFKYWGKIGGDCNVCMRVCPWSHARTLPHKLLVEFIARNSLSRRLFSKMDDVFYGNQPKPHEAPEWAKFTA
ncbi:MAG: hypothetical protein GY866_06455 [Proteobacteria bacterium]|nr:hypothetical protein [Pseudomonadota bacterium]